MRAVRVSKHLLFYKWLAVVVAPPMLLFAGCYAQDSPMASITRLQDQPEYKNADCRILFIGNSHTYNHQMPEVFAQMAEASGYDGKLFVRSQTGPNFTLVQQLEWEQTTDLLQECQWDFVVLQGQKYSTSGAYSYPYQAALTLTEMAKAQGSQVVMFPEWRQRGNLDEAQRVHRLHETIVEQSGAQIAPVGLAWDRALEEQPDLPLHAADGNHNSESGAYLTACVFLASLLDQDPQTVFETGGLTVTEEDQRLLQRVAWETVQAHRND